MTSVEYKLVNKIEALKYKNFYSNKQKLSNVINIEEYGFKEVKKLNENSFSSINVYDLSTCKELSFFKRKIMFELNEIFPTMDSFVKIKAVQLSSKVLKEFNTLQFTINKDENNNKLWITVHLSFTEEKEEEEQDL